MKVRESTRVGNGAEPGFFVENQVILCQGPTTQANGVGVCDGGDETMLVLELAPKLALPPLLPLKVGDIVLQVGVAERRCILSLYVE